MEWTIPAFTPIATERHRILADTHFPSRCRVEGWVGLSGMVTNRGGLPARRRSPIQTLTGPGVYRVTSLTETNGLYTTKPSRHSDIVFGKVSLEVHGTWWHNATVVWRLRHWRTATEFERHRPSNLGLVVSCVRDVIQKNRRRAALPTFPSETASDVLTS